MDQNRNDQRNNNPQDGGKRPRGSIWLAIVITIAIVLIITSIYNAVSSSQYTKTTYSEFMTAKENGQIAEAEIRTDRVL